jgi:hypothetical protein
VLPGLVTGMRTGLVTTAEAARDCAAAKLRRVLPASRTGMNVPASTSPRTPNLRKVFALWELGPPSERRSSRHRNQKAVAGQPASSQKNGNGQASQRYRAPAQAAEFEERPLRGAKTVCKFG